MLLALLLLAGCTRIKGGFVSNDYLSVTPHDEDYDQMENEDALEAATYDEIVEAILTFVEARKESGVIRIAGYDGDVPDAVAQAVYEVMRFTPYGAYYVDYINHDCSRIVSFYEARLYLTYREGVAEQMQSVRGDWAQAMQLYQAMEEHRDAVTLYVSAYTELDFQQLADEYFAAHAETVIVCPQVSAKTYPENGDVRIVELELDYGMDPSLVAARAQAVETALASAVAFSQYRQTETEKMELLWSFLMDRFQYNMGRSEMPIYALLCEGVADSDAFARTLQVLCDRMEIECHTVAGYRDGEAYTWNIVQLDGQYYHIDLMQGMRSEAEGLVLYDDAQMEQYEWDQAAYPACTAAEQTDPVEAEPAPQTPEEENEN